MNSIMSDLIRIRRLKGLNQTEMASLAGLSKQMIIRLENGRLKNAHPATLKKLADAYGVSTEQINDACRLHEPERVAS